MRVVILSLTLTISTISWSQQIDWQGLKNPIFAKEKWSVKDACMIFNEQNDHWYVFFSAFYRDNGRERSHVCAVKTKDFKEFSKPLFLWDGQEEGWIGMCSPNISQIKGKYILTYNSWGDKDGKWNQLFYAVSDDLESWTNHQPLAVNITAGVRAIDAAVTFHDGQYYLMWKKNQTPQVSVASELFSSQWINLGTLNIGWFENAQFIDIDGSLHLVCTGKDHRQFIHIKSKKSEDMWSYTEWTYVSEVDVVEEKFNTNEKMNAGFLLDNRYYDGYFYYLYAGRTEAKSHLGRGNNKLGLARSKDLITWAVP